MEILKPVLISHGFGSEYVDTILIPHFWKYFEDAEHLDTVTGNSIYALLVKSIGKKVAASISNDFDDLKHELF